MRRGQAALEFLSTYGWMVLILAVVGATLAYFDVFDQEGYIPPRCDMGLDFACSKSAIKEDGSVRATIVNNIGYPVDVLSYTCTYPDESEVEDTSNPTNWLPGEEQEFLCEGVALTKNDLASIKVILEYSEDGSFPRTAKGVIEASVAETP